MALEWFSQGGQGWNRKHADISPPHPLSSYTNHRECKERRETTRLDLRNGEFELDNGQSCHQAEVKSYICCALDFASTSRLLGVEPLRHGAGAGA